nr:MAG TPA: hypothetical protein [Bacteriophage sp.]
MASNLFFLSIFFSKCEFLVYFVCKMQIIIYLCIVFNIQHVPNIVKNVELHIINILEIIFNNKKGA